VPPARSCLHCCLRSGRSRRTSSERKTAEGSRSGGMFRVPSQAQAPQAAAPGYPTLCVAPAQGPLIRRALLGQPAQPTRRPGGPARAAQEFQTRQARPPAERRMPRAEADAAAPRRLLEGHRSRARLSCGAHTVQPAGQGVQGREGCGRAGGVAASPTCHTRPCCRSEWLASGADWSNVLTFSTCARVCRVPWAAMCCSHHAVGPSVSTRRLAASILRATSPKGRGRPQAGPTAAVVPRSCARPPCRPWQHLRKSVIAYLIATPPLARCDPMPGSGGRAKAGAQQLMSRS
jgi:hypothetical protein